MYYNYKDQRGLIGRYSVILKLIELGIETIIAPDSWHFDLITREGIKIEVKFATSRTSTGGGGYSHERFEFQIHPKEYDLCDFVILVLDTKKGYLFYIIPIEKVTCCHIAFNPFSKSRSRYLKYKDRWDLILDYSKKEFEKMGETVPVGRLIDSV